MRTLDAFRKLRKMAGEEAAVVEEEAATSQPSVESESAESAQASTPAASEDVVAGSEAAAILFKSPVQVSEPAATKGQNSVNKANFDSTQIACSTGVTSGNLVRKTEKQTQFSRRQTSSAAASGEGVSTPASGPWAARERAGGDGLVGGVGNILSQLFRAPGSSG
jgi:hypothetical protein